MMNGLLNPILLKKIFFNLTDFSHLVYMYSTEVFSKKSVVLFFITAKLNTCKKVPSVLDLCVVREIRITLNFCGQT